MKHFYLMLLLAAVTSATFAQTICENGMAGDYPCERVDIWSTLAFSDMETEQNLNDIWGWTDPDTGNEYAVVGMANGTAFIDVTDPVNPVYLGKLVTHTLNSLWRDIKVYNNHAFIVAEAPGHGMQVFDLTQLASVTEPVDFEETAHYGEFGNAHNIVINEDTGYAYAVGTQTFSGGLHIVDISDPTNPTIAGAFAEDGYTHDAQAVVYHGPDADYCGRELVFCANEDFFTIVDVEDKDDCQLVATETYLTNAYTHQGWLSEDHRFFFLNDELDEVQGQVEQTTTYIWDIRDLDNPEMIGIYDGVATSIDHNYYSRDQLLYQSNYRSGLRVLDISKASEAQLEEVAFLDCQPGDDITQFSGTWSNYCYFPSGTVVMTDMYSGLFILRVRTSAADYDINVANDVDETVFNAYLSYQPGSSNIQVNGLPSGVNASVATATFPGPAPITLTGLEALDPGSYPFTVSIEFDGTTDEHEAIIRVSANDSPELTLTSPAEGIDTGIQPNFGWTSGLSNAEYTVQVASDADFTDILFEETTSSLTLIAPFSLPEDSYFWRVLADGACGESLQSPVGSFNVNVTSVGEAKASDIAVYPNPATDLLYVSGGKTGDIIELYATDGRLVKTFALTGEETQNLSVADVNAGMYILKTREGQTQSLMIE
jgi:choice-of-anchor B domain-containing protein